MENKTMMTDLYELTMAQVYFNSDERDKIAFFDAFFRKEPLEAGYGIMAGLDNIIEYIENLKFTKENIDYLKSLNLFDDDFLEYLSRFKFSGNIYAIPDGTPVFRNEPLVTIEAPIIEAQIVETAILSYLNASICYTTATRKIVEASNNIAIMEFGARRAFGPDSAVEASKCSIIGGASGTSNVLAGEKYKIPVMGTMAHSLITQSDNEYEAFLNFAKTYPENCVLLVDTYNVLKSGIPNAIKVAKEYLMPRGYRLKGIRIDSGDLAYLSKESKKMLVNAGLDDVKICLSNGLKAETIRELLDQGAVIDSIGLGDNIVAPDKARVGVVYKNVGVLKNKKIEPKIKLSSDSSKTINPGFKKVYRFYDKETGYALGDVIALKEEKIEEKEYLLIDPEDETNTTKIKNYNVKELQKPIFEQGKLIYKDLGIYEKREYCNQQMKTLYSENKRIHKQNKYYVDLSEALLKLKKKMIFENKKI